MVALMVSAIAFAQTTGKVVDADNNQPLPGATVVVKGSNKGTVTDFDGNFSIDAAAGDMLEVSFLGYESSVVAASNGVVIRLAMSFNELGEGELEFGCAPSFDADRVSFVVWIWVAAAK